MSFVIGAQLGLRKEKMREINGFRVIKSASSGDVQQAKDLLDDLLEERNCLREEVRKLRNEAYLNEKLKVLEEENRKLWAERNSSAFVVTEEEQKAIDEWIRENHYDIGNSEYRFTPTAIGVFGEVMRVPYGKVFTFREP